MRNKHSPRRGGNTGGNTSRRSTPKLKNRDDFSSTLKDNLVELMKATKEETHHFRANACDMAVTTKVVKDLLNLKQGPHESLLEQECPG